MAQATSSSARKLLSVLLAFTHDRPSLSVQDLGTITGLPQSSVYRFLLLLRDTGLVEGQGDGHYTLGPTMLTLGRVAMRNQSHTEVIAPVMDGLRTNSGETVILVRRSGLHAVCIDRRESHHHLSLSFEVGQVMDLGLGAVAKVVLAHAPSEVQEQCIELVTSGGQGDWLANELETIRQEGYAESLGEVDEGIWGVAAPVFVGGDEVLGLSIAGPHSRMDEHKKNKAKTQVIEAAEHLSSKLATG